MPNIKIKIFIRTVLLIVVIGSVGYLAAKEMLYGPASEAPVKAQAVTATAHNSSPDHIVAYYFHGNFRCAKCKMIEAYSRESIEKNFQKELAGKTLIFKIVNVDEPMNRHFIQDYDLYTKSLVIAAFDGDKQIKFKNLEKVWDNLGSKSGFEDYVRTELSAYLGEVKK